jgi:Zn finger protein HypA/HybF involved in hydrogenase expression
MSAHTPFVCHDCSERVSSTAYRAACPNCGGTLRSRVAGGNRWNGAVSPTDVSDESA